jgi:protein-tyrosine phosphatase
MLEPSIHWVRDIEPHRLALMPRPRGGADLADEITLWRRAGIDAVVSLLEASEVRELDLREEGALCEARRIAFTSFPIPDRGLPARRGECVALLNGLHEQIVQGRRVAVHCRAGIGRSGLIAGGLLHLLGIKTGEIFPMLSRARGVAVPDTVEQAAWVETFATRSKDVL